MFRQATLRRACALTAKAGLSDGDNSTADDEQQDMPVVASFCCFPKGSQLSVRQSWLASQAQADTDICKPLPTLLGSTPLPSLLGSAPLYGKSGPSVPPTVLAFVPGT